MAFHTLAPPAKHPGADPDGVRISVKAGRKRLIGELRVYVSLGANLFEKMGATSLAEVLIGDGPDKGKLQVRLFEDGEEGDGYEIRMMRSTAMISCSVPGVQRALQRVEVPHDLHEGLLTFALPREIFHAPPD